MNIHFFQLNNVNFMDIIVPASPEQLRQMSDEGLIHITGRGASKRYKLK